MALISCSECGREMSDAATACPHCGMPLIPTSPPKLPEPQQDVMSAIAIYFPMILGQVGACLVALGTFLPFVQVPLAGSLNYFNNAQGDGLIILACAALAAVGFTFKRFKIALLPAFIAGALLAFDVGLTLSRIQNIKEELRSALADNPYADLATGLAETMQLSIGPFVIGIGLILVFVAAFRGKQAK